MARPSPVLPFVVALLAPSVAWAGGTAVVAPFVASGVDEKTTKNLTGLVSSELDFSGAYDTVNELTATPAASCITTVSCMAGLAKANSADAVVVGVVTPGAKGMKVQVVLFDAKKGAIAKNKSWEMGTGIADAADQAPKMVKELLGAASPAAETAKETAKVSIDTTEEDDFSFSDTSKPKTKMAPTVKPKSLDDIPEDEDLDAEDAAAKAKADADRAKAEAAAQAKAEAAAKAKADAEAKAKAAAAAQAKAEAEAKARAEAEAKAQAAAEAKAKAEAKARADAEARRLAEEEAEEAAEAARVAKEAAAAKSKKTTTAPVEDDEDLFADDPKPTSAKKSVVVDTEDELEDEPPAKPTTAKATTPPPAPKKALSDEISDEELERQLAGFKLSGSVADGTPTAVVAEEEPAPKKYTSTKSYDDEDEPVPAKKATAVKKSYDDEDEPVAKKKSSSYDDEDEPVAKKKSSSSYDDDEPVAKKKSSSYDDDEPVAKKKSWDDDEPVAKKKAWDDDEPVAKKKSSYDDEDEPVAKKKSSYYDDDEPVSKKKSSYDDDYGSSRVTKKSREDDESPKNHVEFSARAGYSRYDDFNFVNYGGELAIPVTSGIYAMLGAEGASTNRGYTEQEKNAIATQNGITADQVEDWNTILPFNVGVQYKATANKVQPYGGADLTITPYTANFDVAFGARARGGVDFLVAKSFGLNLDLALGFMSGDKLQYVAEGVPKIGFLPRISAGTVIVF